jgi:carbamoyltransferase
MYILGLTTMGNSSACLFKNNELLYAIEEERLSRIKNDSSFPLKSINACLEYENIKLSDVEIVTVYWKPFNFFLRLYRCLEIFIKDPFKNIFIFKRALEIFFLSEKEKKEKTGKWFDLFILNKLLKKNFGTFNGKIKFYHHHLTHQLYGIALSKFKNALVLSYDGGGENTSTEIIFFKDDQIINLKKIYWPNSLGHFYSYFTGYLGFKMLEGEYKMMGLAPYGKPLFKEYLRKNVLTKSLNKDYKFNYTKFSYHKALKHDFEKINYQSFPAPRLRNEEINQNHIDLASSVQSLLEDIVIETLQDVKVDFQNEQNLILSGGCALNVTLNGKILSNKIFRNIIIPPAPHDAGCSIGSVLSFFYKNNDLKFLYDKKTKSKIASPYLGFSYDLKTIENTLIQYSNKINFKLLDYQNTIELAAQALNKNKIIAWYQGRDEIGPRALGNRSFLANPSTEEIRDIINKKIKKREPFRPFAPSVLLHEAKNYFELDNESPYMNIVAKVRENKKSLIPAVVHVDGTCRVHTVAQNFNKKYFDLLTKFYEISKIPVLLNTSFNINEPIVSTPKDAVETFLKSDVDYLIIENFVVQKIKTILKG